MDRRHSRDTSSTPPVFEALLVVTLFLACLVGSAP